MTATTDSCDARYAIGASGALTEFNRAGVLVSADIHVARTIGRLGGEADERVLLAAAFAVRAVRMGSVCVDLYALPHTSAADSDEPVDLAALPWPDPPAWYAACEASPVVASGPGGEADRPLRLVDRLLYLDRYWRQEELARVELADRAARPLPGVDEGLLGESLAALFPGPAPDHQRLAAAACATGWVTVVAGGPGTGKTTTVARVLALLHRVLDHPPRVALAAPTGKAAARLQEAVAGETGRLAAGGFDAPGALAASTLHRLLGFRPGSHTRFRHDRDNRLPYDVVVVDETSMVSLTLMSRLLEAVRPDTRLVLVGDPDQLASVEAGAVLGDLVHRSPRPGPDPRAALLARIVADDMQPGDEVEDELRNDVVRLRTTHRFGASIGALAAAIRAGDADAVLEIASSGDPGIEFVQSGPVERQVPAAFAGLRADVRDAGGALIDAARAGDAERALAALDRHRLLCAHRRGPYGVGRWSAQAEQWLAEARDGYATDGEWYVGRPLIVTANDHDLRLYNGDTGVVVDCPGRGKQVAFARGDRRVLLAPSRLPDVQTVHAMTVHRSQGSQFERVSVLLPPEDSPLLTRELLYTAVTRAREFVRIVGTPAALRLATTRPIVRASGLRRRLAADSGGAVSRR